MVFAVILFIAAVIAGSVASVAGFGIGSLLTPLMIIKTDIYVAVAAVSIAHLAGTALRFYIIRKSLDRKIFITFGITSAAGGLAGALLHNFFQNIILTIIFGGLLILAGLLGLTGLSEKFRLKGSLVWFAGGLSGLFGGLVGNQGGIRSAALLGFEMDKTRFVATATGIALLVDAARVPVYLAFQWRQLLSVWQFILIGIAGVIIGTVGGKKILEKIPEYYFRKIVAFIILAVGISILVLR